MGSGDSYSWAVVIVLVCGQTWPLAPHTWQVRRFPFKSRFEILAGKFCPFFLSSLLSRKWFMPSGSSSILFGSIILICGLKQGALSPEQKLNIWGTRNSVPSTHLEQFTITCNSRSRGSAAPLLVSGRACIQRNRPRLRRMRN